MDFELSEEQQLLKQTCERYFADHYQFEIAPTLCA